MESERNRTKEKEKKVTLRSITKRMYLSKTTGTGWLAGFALPLTFFQKFFMTRLTQTNESDAP